MSDVDTGSVDKRKRDPPVARPAAGRGAARAVRRHRARPRRTRGPRPRTRSGSTRLLRQLLAAAPRIEQPVAVVAIGGYGPETALPPFGHRSPRALRRPPGSARGGTPPRDSAPAVGSAAWWSATRSARSTSSRASKWTTRSFSWRWSMRGRSPATLALYRRFEAAFHHAGTHAHVVGALNTLIDERHAQFNGDALPARTGRQGRARRAARSHGHARDRGAHRSVAAPARAGRSRAARRGRGFSAARPLDPAPGDEAQPERRSATRCRKRPPSCSGIRARCRSSASSG